jgi:hypothetical protein
MIVNLFIYPGYFIFSSKNYSITPYKYNNNINNNDNNNNYNIMKLIELIVLTLYAVV